MPKNLALTILDGWGVGSKDATNPIHLAQPAFWSYLTSNFPHGALQSAGIAVGLPWEEPGNSYAGHLNLGAGRIVYQDYPRISLAVQNQELKSNPALQDALTKLKSSNGTLHLVSLISLKHHHSDTANLKALISLASAAGIPYRLHLITDGLDSPPQSSLDLITSYDSSLIASLSGRYYAMDTDERWTLTAKAYQAVLGQIPTSLDPVSYLKSCHQKNLSDAYIPPASFNSKPLTDSDTLFFVNFNAAGLHQLASAFIDPDLVDFPTSSPPGLSYLTMTSYDNSWSVPALFPPLDINNSLCQVIADHNLISIKIGETIKYASLTYYLNGYREAPFKNEYRVLLPSPDNPHPEKTPDLRLAEVTSRTIQSINEGVFNLIITNLANPDIIGRTGDLSATVSAVSAVDKSLEQITKSTLAAHIPHLIVGSHGNVEEMVDRLTGVPETGNTKNPVPICLVDPSLARPQSPDNGSTLGLLADVAPTILNLLDLPVPPDMTGQSLLPYLR